MITKLSTVRYCIKEEHTHRRKYIMQVEGYCSILLSGLVKPGPQIRTILLQLPVVPLEELMYLFCLGLVINTHIYTIKKKLILTTAS